MAIGIGMYIDKAIDREYKKVKKEEVEKVSKLRRLVQRVVRRKK